MKLLLDDSQAMERGLAHLFGGRVCIVCGRELRDRFERDWLLVARGAGGEPYVVDHPREALAIETNHDDMRDVWIAPIGPDCLRAHPEYRFGLIGAHKCSARRWNRRPSPKRKAKGRAK